MFDLLKAGVDVYASMETLTQVGAISHHRAHAIHETLGDGLFSVCNTAPCGQWSIRPFDTVHDAPGSIGFIVEDGSGDRLLFLTDTGYVKYLMPPCNIVMIEANFSESILQHNVDAGLIDAARAKRVRESHMSIGRVLDFLKANDLSRCRAIHLIHGSDSCSNSELFKRMVQEATGIPTFVEG